MRWECRATSVRAHMGVHNSHGLPLILGVQVLTLKPWKLTAYLMIYGQHIRRSTSTDHTGTGPVVARSGSSAPTSTGSPRRTRTRSRTSRMTFLHCTKQADTPQPGPDTARRVATRGRISRGLPDRPSCGSPRAQRRRPGRRRGSAHDRTSWPYAQVVDDDVLVIETSLACHDHRRRPRHRSSGHALAQGRP